MHETRDVDQYTSPSKDSARRLESDHGGKERVPNADQVEHRHHKGGFACNRGETEPPKSEVLRVGKKVPEAPANDRMSILTPSDRADLSKALNSFDLLSDEFVSRESAVRSLLDRISGILCRRVERGESQMTSAGSEDTAGESLELPEGRRLISGIVRRAAREIAGLYELARSQEELIRSLKARLEQADRSLSEMIALDPVTGLPGHGGLEEILTEELKMAARQGTKLLAVRVRLGNFIKIRDSLGHAVADLVAKTVAQQLRGSLRSVDHVGRTAEDEFLVLLPGTKLSGAERVAKRLHLALQETPLEISGEHSDISATVGFLEIPPNTASLSDVLSLFRAKESGTRFIGKQPGQPGAPEDECDGSQSLLAITEALRLGHGIRAVSQPIVRISDNDYIGYELLTRGLPGAFENPADFFRIAYEQNILSVVDRHCIRTCVNAAMGLTKDTQWHINVFPSTLLDTPEESMVRLFTSQRCQGRFCVEISEQQILGDPTPLTRPITALRNNGILIAMDDVGFGRTCLESLIILEPDIIKVDRRCVDMVSAERLKQSELKRLLKVADALGAEVVAEGVENQADLGVLKELGVKYGQGYFWARPS